jgi:hypothetical protein
METLKERVKRWVAKERGGVATIYNIKKHYKWFRTSNHNHWELLAMMMMPDLFPNAKEPTEKSVKRDMSKERYQQLVRMCDYLRVTYGVRATGWDFVGRCTANLQYESLGCGYIGWLESRQSWIYGTSSHTLNCESLEQAVETFLGMCPHIF